MPTIKDVAEKAGVAVGTVSHVITGSVRVSDALRLKVQTAIDELDYHPNHVARSLKTNKTRTLGIVVPELTISFFPRIIEGADAAARQRGYTLIAVNSHDDAARQKDLLSLFRSQRVEGVLLVLAAGAAPASQIHRMVEAGMPVVCVDRIPDKVPVDSVSVEDVSAAAMGVSHLVSTGHRRIAIVTGPLALKNECGRLQGYKQALRRADLPVEDDLIWQGNLRPEDVAAMCGERLDQCDAYPDAIFATNGPTGLGVLRAFRERGLRAPEDIAFATFDELTVDDLFRPSVTTIVQPAFQIGSRATEILLDRIEGGAGAGEPLTVRLPATWIIRESSGAAAPMVAAARRLR